MSDRAACPYAMSFTMLEVQRCWNYVLNHLDGAPLNVMELVEGDHVLLFSSQIVGDAVGWGFVVRGSKPCHIQAVDPSGPAAAAGMKVGFLNGIIYWGISAALWRSWAACTWGMSSAFVSRVEYLCLSFRCWCAMSSAAFCPTHVYFLLFLRFSRSLFHMNIFILSKLHSWSFPFFCWLVGYGVFFFFILFWLIGLVWFCCFHLFPALHNFSFTLSNLCSCWYTASGLVPV